MFRSKEQQNFSNIIAAHIADGDAPLLLEGGTGIGKTRAYLHSLIQSGLRVAIVFPTHQLIEQMLNSADLIATRGSATVAAFKPARMFESRSDYEINRRLAIDAQVMFCTAASVIIDQRAGGEYNGSTGRAYLLFDEADQLPDMAALQSDFLIKKSDLMDIGVKITNERDALMAILALKIPIDPEIKASARIILEAIENPAWYKTTGINDHGDIELKHKLPGRLLKKISNRGNTAFVSATLTIGGRFKDFQVSMGIENTSHLSGVIDPEKHGDLKFSIVNCKIDTDEWVDEIVKAAAGAPKPVLIATTSYALTELLGERIPGAIMRFEEETTSQAAARVGPEGLLISAGAWAGLDTPIRWRSVIIPRVPYKRLDVINEEVTTSYFDSRNTAIRRLRQVFGRGLRSPDAVCDVYILDERINALNGFVPSRFDRRWSDRSITGDAKTFLEGGRREIVLSKSERCPSIRKSALKHYGKKCMGGCGLVLKSDSQLDVHHTNPISDGVRQTRMEDLSVLCANCHRLAHSEDPPLSIDTLVAINA